MTESVTKYAHLESSRIRVLDNPNMHPGTCVLCGASRNDDRKYVDIGLDIDFVGVIYFCTFCMQELANRLGCLMPDQTKKLEDELDSARQTIINFQAQKAAYDDAIGKLRGTGLFSDTDPNLSTITWPTVDPVAEQEPVAEPVGSKQDVTRPNKSTKQSNSKQGPNDIPESGSYDFGISL